MSDQSHSGADSCSSENNGKGTITDESLVDRRTGVRNLGPLRGAASLFSGDCRGPKNTLSLTALPVSLAPDGESTFVSEESTSRDSTAASLVMLQIPEPKSQE